LQKKIDATIREKAPVQMNHKVDSEGVDAELVELQK
jgi:hypothetical protein